MYEKGYETTVNVMADQLYDFGSTTNFKVGANFAFNEFAGVRATFSTGFKAPTPGQSNASNISTQIVGGIHTRSVSPRSTRVARSLLQSATRLPTLNISCRIICRANDRSSQLRPATRSKPQSILLTWLPTF